MVTFLPFLTFYFFLSIKRDQRERVRFKLTRAEHNRLAACHLNHSATSSAIHSEYKIQIKYIQNI